jgi:thioredoxin-related protein
MFEHVDTGRASDAIPPAFGIPESPDFGDRNHFKNLDAPLVGDGGRIEWAASLKDGIKQAQEQGKPLICVFEEAQCGWCKRFDQELAKPAAAALGENAIFVRISPSTDPDGRGLATNLGINSYPTVSVLDINGSSISERTRMTGYMTLSDFASHIQPDPVALA